MKKPKYEQLAQSLLKKINRGLYANGKLPAMSAIAREYGVNLQTANRAVKFLEQRGIVTCFSGKKGTVIDPARASLSAVNTSGNNAFLVDQVFGSTVRNKIRFIHTYFNNQVQECFKNCAELFTRRYPWVEVELIPVDDIRRLADREIDYDAALVIGRDVRRLARKGEFLKLDAYPRLAETAAKNFVPGIWKNGHLDEDLYAVPFSWSVPLYAVREGERSFNWQNPAPAQKCAGSFNIGLYSLICLFLGEPLLNKDFCQKEKSLRDLLAFLKKLCVTAEGELIFWDNPAALKKFDTRTNHFICGYYSNINNIIGKEKNWHYAALPACPGGQKVIVTEFLAVNARTEFVPECLLWLKFLQSETAQAEFMDVPFFLPIRRNMLKQLPGELVQCFDEALDGAIQPQLSSTGLYRLYSCIYPLLAKYFSGEIPEKKIISDIFELLHEEIVLDNL